MDKDGRKITLKIIKPKQLLHKISPLFNKIREYFKKKRVDVFGMTLPKYWHVKSNTAVIENGYVNRIWFYNDTRRSPFGMWLNQDKEIFKDINVRYAFAHAMNVQKVIEKVLRNDYFRLEQCTLVL